MHGIVPSSFAACLLAACTMAVASVASAGTPVAAVPKHLVVHEWGTFTSFQDGGGTTIGGINVDDEPVPAFVHRIEQLTVTATNALPVGVSKGAPSCHPDVTLRLETPVLYFYPQPGFDTKTPIDVKAEFPGGWLTEFYPNAKSTVPGFPKALEPTDRGTLQWRRLRLISHPSAALPETSEHVWLAPRKVKSTVIATDDEREKYLFYRGVGNRESPIVVRSTGDLLTVTRREGEKALTKLPLMWLVQVKPDGRVWYRVVSGQGNRATVSSVDRGDEAGDLDGLRKRLAAALIAHGLFADEAHAMLDTWKRSYFASEGIRLLFLLPQPWTDANLPLTFSNPVEKVRVMLGRIELVSTQQQAALEQLYDLPESAFGTAPLSATDVTVARDLGLSQVEAYRKAGRDLPEPLLLYDKLGRFRDALLVHEWHSTSDPVRRTRIQTVIRKFGSCSPALGTGS